MSLHRRLNALVALLLLSATVLPTAGNAQVVKGVELVKADLLADTSAITPGKPFTVGLRLVMAPHWHTYWQYSGDAGLPTKITWSLPEGFKAGPIQWPLPEKISSPGDIENYGYGEEVLLLTEITPPAQLPVGNIALKAKADWLVCAEICVPGSGQLDLALPGSVAGNQAQPANVEIFAKYRALLPRPYNENAARFSVARSIEGNDLVLRLQGLQLTPGQTVELFPLPPDSVQVGHPAAVAGDSSSIRVPIIAGIKDAGQVAGVLVVGAAGADRRGWILPAESTSSSAATDKSAVTPAPANSKAAGIATAPPSRKSLGYFLLVGLLGGLILNVMPCVLPVISLKLFSFIKQADDDPGRIFRMGLAYAAGVFAWFLGFATLVIIFKAAGRQLGYSFQFQNPWLLLALVCISFVFALNLLGVFEIILPGSVSNAAGDAAAHSGGYSGAFFQGVLATVLGSACTAPFFGEALGFALGQSGFVILLMFAAIAAGMSAPFVLLAARPAWLRYLPRPGAWMERVKQATGFLMLATVLWLLSVFGDARGLDAAIWAGALLLVLAAACWVQGAFNNFTASDRMRWTSRVAILVIVLAGGGFCVQQIVSAKPAVAASTQPFKTQLEAALKSGRPVFVDFTASWCTNCKFYERFVLNTDPVQDALRKHNAIFLTADWSQRDDEITAVLAQFQRAAVPLYVIYPAGNPTGAIVLPDFLTVQAVLDGLSAADKAANGMPLAAR